MKTAPAVQTVRVGCKVNLGLRITGVRANGYHELDSLFYPLAEPADELRLEAVSEPGISVSCDRTDIDPTHNTLTRAYAAFAAQAPGLPGLRAHVRKGIPHGAGLGGGSADAAAVLRWCNARVTQPLSDTALAAVGLKVGADVPFFLQSAPCRVRGIGEVLSPAAFSFAGLWLVLLCPPVQVSTPWAYGAWDKEQSQPRTGHRPFSQHFLKERTSGLTTESLNAKEVNSCATCPPLLVNDLESVVFAAHPALAECKAALLQEGAAAAVMSGSGATLVGLFRQENAARQAARTLHSRDRRVCVAAL